MTAPLPLSVAIALCANPAVGATSHPFSVHDMLAMQRISEPRVSPDGKRVVFTVRTTDMEENKGKTSLWLVRDGRERTSAFDRRCRPTTAILAGRPMARRSSFFPLDRERRRCGGFAVDGGEAEQVTHLPLDVKNLLLSPDGRHMALTMEVFPGGHGVEGTKQKLAEAAKRKSTRARL